MTVDTDRLARDISHDVISAAKNHVGNRNGLPQEVIDIVSPLVLDLGLDAEARVKALLGVIAYLAFEIAGPVEGGEPSG